MPASIDLHLCLEPGCISLSSQLPCYDFTALDSACSPAAPPLLSTRTTVSADGRTAQWVAYTDEACTKPAPVPVDVLVLDGACRAGTAFASYSATLHGVCREPDPLLPSFIAMTDAMGKRSGDLGNYDVCRAAGNAHCVIADTSTGLFLGACLPSACGPADVSNTSAPIWAYLASQAPILALFNASHLQVHCGDNAYAWDAGAIATITALAVAAACVLGATLYTLLVASAAKGAPGKGEEPRASRLPKALDACLRGAALSTTVPRMLGSSSRGAAQYAHLAAFDGVRVLSLSMVVLGHSLFFPLSLTGFSNGSAVYTALGDAAVQVFPSAEFAVDTFFLLSGALGAMLLTKAMRKALKALEVAGQRGSGGGAGSSSDGSGVEDAGDNGGDAGSDSARVRLLAINADGDGNDDSRRHLPSRHAALPSTPWALARRAACIAYVWVFSVVHRFLRLLPSVAALICVFTYVAPLLGSGPVWSLWDGARESCTDHAWASLLFVGNYFPGPSDGLFGRACAGWLWYLSVDLQLHAVALPPLVVAFALWPRGGWALLVAAIVSTLAASTAIVVQQSLTFQAALTSPALDGDYTDVFYDKPAMRAPAFLVGVALGWAIEAIEARAAVAADKLRGDGGDAPPPHSRPPLRHRVLTLVLPASPDDGTVDVPASALLCCALALLGWLFYIPVGAYSGSLVYFQLASGDAVPWSTATQQAYTILSRPAWAAGVAALLLCCAAGRGGALQTLLAARVWTPVALLSFSAYLYHPVVLYVLGLNVVTQPRYSAAYIATTYAATCVYAVLAAALMYALVEAPAAALEKLLFAAAGIA